MVITGPRTFGFDRRAQVPSLPGSKPKLCSNCQAWFAAGSKQRRCDRCVPATQRRERETARVAAQEAEQATKSRQRKPERVLGVSLCRELAYELAARIDGVEATTAPRGRVLTMSRADAYRITARRVADGLQDPRDLARYAP